LFAPDGKKKWYLITSLDDHSRALLYATFLERESTWSHIMVAEFKLKSSFESTKDIFCLRFERRVNSYRRISLMGQTLQVPKVMPRQKVELRLYPDMKTGLTEVRFWHKGQFQGSQNVKNSDIPIVYF
jgi:hypothetical protein